METKDDWSYILKKDDRLREQDLYGVFFKAFQWAFGYVYLTI